MLGPALAAFANRAWGEKASNNVVAMVIFWMAIIIAHPGIFWASPIFVTGFYIARRSSPRPWLDMHRDGSWKAGIERGLHIVPLISLYSVHLGPHYLALLAGVFLIPAGYRLAGRLLPTRCTELAELNGGIWLSPIP